MAILMFWGFAVVYALRVNLSVAIVDMVPATGTNKSNRGECAKNLSTYSPIELTLEPMRAHNNNTYDWTSEQQGLVLGAFFYGYITTQFLGGYLADRFGAKILFGVGVGCTSILTILTKPIADLGFGYMIALRVLEGIGEGVTFPAATSFWGRWAPPNERASLAALAYSGAQFGTIISMPISGIICQTLGWPSMFYIFGSISCIWVVIWFILAESTPAKYSGMAPRELEYITAKLPSSKQSTTSVPWLNILCSIPFWSILFAHVCFGSDAKLFSITRILYTHPCVIGKTY